MTNSAIVSLSDLPVYHCRKIEQPINIDGDLSKEAWQKTPAILLRFALGNGAPQQKTTVRACWDGAVLYFAFDCEDADIRATMANRNELVWQEEAVEAFIGPYGDLVHYYEFQCNPLNTVNDVRVTNPNARGVATTFDRPWTCQGWQTAVRIFGTLNDPGARSQGWCSEWAIPLSSVLEPGAEPVLTGEEWRVNLFRIDRWPVEEFSAWSPNPLPPVSFHKSQYFGRWIFD
jgi:hypothetical protein